VGGRRWARPRRDPIFGSMSRSASRRSRLPRCHGQSRCPGSVRSAPGAGQRRLSSRFPSWLARFSPLIHFPGVGDRCGPGRSSEPGARRGSDHRATLGQARQIRLDESDIMYCSKSTRAPVLPRVASRSSRTSSTTEGGGRGARKALDRLDGDERLVPRSPVGCACRAAACWRGPRPR
jgi:hypothetical protein